MSIDNSALRIGQWRVDPSLDEISRDGRTVKLECRQMRLLMCLAARPGEVLSVERLLGEAWSGVVVTQDSVYKAIAALRKELGDDARDPAYIANVPRRGYRLIAPVSPWSQPAAVVAPAVAPGAAPAAAATGATPAAPLVAPVFAPEVAPAFARSRSLRWVAAVLLLGLLAAASRWYAGRGDVPASVALAAAPIVAGPVPEQSIAVLPFLDMSEHHDQGYFSDGLSEELIDLLTHVADLRVPARTSSFSFRGKSEDIVAIARQLRVAHVLEGSVRRSGQKIRVTVQLIRADSGYHLWSETYDRDVHDVFSVQDEIAGAVVASLRLKLASSPAATSRTGNPEAHNQYLLGRQRFDLSNDAQGMRQAVDAFHQSIALDPGYASAYAELATAEGFLADLTGDDQGLARARAAAEKAVALAPALSDGYIARAYLRFNYFWDWAGAQADLARALALDPNNGTAQRRFGQMLQSLGRLPEAVAAGRKSTDLDPLSQQAWQDLGQFLMHAGDLPAALAANARALEIQPDDTFALNDLGTLQLLSGQARQARATFGRMKDESFRLEGIAMTEHALGNEPESQRALAELVADHANEAAYQIALACTWRGERDQAFTWLDRAFAQHDGGLTQFMTDPLAAGLHGDPRFRELLRKLKLPDAPAR